MRRLGCAVWLMLCLLGTACCSKRDAPAESTSAGSTRRADGPGAPATTNDTVGTGNSVREAPDRSYFKGIEGIELDGPLTMTEGPRNSFVLIVADALNVRHLSAYGYVRPTSPVIDGLAREGIQFLDHVSNSSWTRPSFTTIITGYPKSRHGVELRGGWRLKPEITTLAERFRNAGYRTAGYTGNPLVRKSWGFDQGFQVYEGPTTLGLKAFPRDRVLVDRALKWLEAQKDRPFFLTLFLTSPHPPYQPPMEPRRFLSTVAAGKIIEHPFKEYAEPLPRDDHDRIVAAYDDEIAYMDEQIGRILDALRDSGRLDHTTVVVTADHGEMFGQHNCYLHVYHMWEPALRVPLIIRSPRIAQKGVVDRTPFTHVDLAPTLLDLAGIPYDNSDLRGLSIVSEAGRGARHAARIRLSQYNAHGVRRQAVRQDRWKLVHHHKVSPLAAERLDELHDTVAQPDPRNLPSLAWEKERYELYDLVADPGEERDLYADRRGAEDIRPLEAALKAHLAGGSDSGQISGELLRALEAVGYISSDKQ